MTSMLTRISVVCLTMCLLAVTTLAAQPIQHSSLPNIDRFGLDGFRLMLQRQGLTTLQKSPGAALNSPESTVVVVIGDTRAARPLWANMQRFVQRGGALLLATDLGNTSFFGVRFERFRHGMMQFPLSYAYQEQTDCPRVTDLDRRHPLLDGVNEIITNRPGCLRPTSRARTRNAAWLPSIVRRQYPLVATGTDQRRLILVADHSLFINEMLLHGDNAKLADNVAKWLCAGGKRKHLVFIDNGLVLPAWQLGQMPPPLPLRDLIEAARLAKLARTPLPNESLVAFLNRFITSLEDKNGFNASLLNPFPRSSMGVLRRSVAFAAMALAIAIFLHWLVRTKWRLGRWLTRQDLTIPVELRERTGVQSKQYGPCLRVLAREFFVQGDGRLAVDWQHTVPLPHVMVERNQGSRDLAHDVRYFWRLATMPRIPRIGPRRFGKLVKRLQRLRQLQNAGILQLEWN